MPFACDIYKRVCLLDTATWRKSGESFQPWIKSKTAVTHFSRKQKVNQQKNASLINPPDSTKSRCSTWMSRCTEWCTCSEALMNLHCKLTRRWSSSSSSPANGDSPGKACRPPTYRTVGHASTHTESNGKTSERAEANMVRRMPIKTDFLA